MTLPVAEICAALSTQLQQNNRVLLTAPPGAGKSTYLPLYLLQHPDFADKHIIMLEPRRLAAKSIAAFLATQLGEAVGQTVGYQIKGEQERSGKTRLLIVTEGVLIRKIQQDPELAGVDLLIFDEFHERSLQADLALALSLEVQQLNDQLKLLIMSATLAGRELSEKLQAPFIQSAGRSFPVEVRYQSPTADPLWLQAARLSRQLLLEHQGSQLVFLPGQAEISQARDYLTEQQLPMDVDVFALLGSLTLAQQQQAIAASATGRRKIVLATNVAETSLTIDGITVVIDSGVARQAVYQPKLGFSKLETIQISQASAVQRAGRAGRLAAGCCYRLDTPEKWARRPAFTTPDILQADLIGLRLEIAGWGAKVEDLFWLDLPPKAQLAAAEQCLYWLGALDKTQQLTAHGRAMLKLPTEPRLASMLLHAKKFVAEGYPAAPALAALMAALLEQNKKAGSCDLTAQLKYASGPVLQQAKLLLQQLGFSSDLFKQSLPEQLCGVLLSFAFPDRIAQQRGQGYLLANGTGAVLPPDDALAHSPYLVVADLRLFGKDAQISTACAFSLEDLQSHWSAQLETERHFAFDEQNGRFIAEQRQRFGALVLKRQNISTALTGNDKSLAWLDWLQKRGLNMLNWTEAALNLKHRIMLAARLQPEAQWPDCSDTALIADAANWLAPYLSEINNLAALQKLDIRQLLWQRLSYPQQLALNKFLPASWRSVLGTDITLLYSADADSQHGVSMAIRLQEMFGQSETPTVADGAIAVTITLLSPSKQPLQLTRDLASFWQNAYQDVKKEMRGRYPKHFWPDNPLEAMPTNKTKKAMQK